LRVYLSPKGCTFLWKSVTSPTGFAKEFFRRARRDEEKRGRRSKSYADELFEEQRSQTGNTEAKCSLKTTQKKK